jgi:hypothetical protein
MSVVRLGMCYRNLDSLTQTGTCYRNLDSLTQTTNGVTLNLLLEIRVFVTFRSQEFSSSFMRSRLKSIVLSIYVIYELSMIYLLISFNILSSTYVMLS